jgi:hypothetical protein
MAAIIVGLLAGLMGLLATAVTAVLSLHRSVTAVAARATTARVWSSARDRADGDSEVDGPPEGTRHAQEHRLVA